MKRERKKGRGEGNGRKKRKIQSLRLNILAKYELQMRIANVAVPAQGYRTCVVFAIRTAAITVHFYSCILTDTYFTSSLNKLSFSVLCSTRLTLHNSGLFKIFRDSEITHYLTLTYNS